jgi:hypothetical protein
VKVLTSLSIVEFTKKVNKNIKSLNLKEHEELKMGAVT